MAGSPELPQDSDGARQSAPEEADRFGRGHHPAPGGPVAADHPAALSGQFMCLALIVDGTDELRGAGEGRVTGIDQRLADEAAGVPAWQRAAQCPDQPVADHPLGLRAERVERVGMGQRRVARAFQCQHANLRAVAVGDHHVVPAGQRRERCHGSLNVRFLDVGVGLLVPLQQRVPAKRRHDPHGRGAIVATIRALMVCSLFSAWSKTMEAGDSKTSSVTSSASRPRLS